MREHSDDGPQTLGCATSGMQHGLRTLIASPMLNVALMSGSRPSLVAISLPCSIALMSSLIFTNTP